jgi:hypothetical protein
MFIAGGMILGIGSGVTVAACNRASEPAAVAESGDSADPTPTPEYDVSPSPIDIPPMPEPETTESSQSPTATPEEIQPTPVATPEIPVLSANVFESSKAGLSEEQISLMNELYGLSLSDFLNEFPRDRAMLVIPVLEVVMPSVEAETGEEYIWNVTDGNDPLNGTDLRDETDLLKKATALVGNYNLAIAAAVRIAETGDVSLAEKVMATMLTGIDRDGERAIELFEGPNSPTDPIYWENASLPRIIELWGLAPELVDGKVVVGARLAENELGVYARDSRTGIPSMLIFANGRIGSASSDDKTEYIIVVGKDDAASARIASL